MHNTIILHICRDYSLGHPVTEPAKCSAGRFHFTYKVITDTGRYIIKILHPTVKNNVNTYNAAEKTAANFQFACAAIQHNGGYVYQTDTDYVIVYPYLDGEPLENQEQITIQHVDDIATSLAKIHISKINHIPTQDQSPDLSNLISNTSIKKLTTTHPDVSTLLQSNLNKINMIIEYYQQHYTLLKEDAIISHRDLDIKNVLWDNKNNHYIIDWESIGMINRTRDVIATAIYWSIDSNYQIRDHLFFQFIKKYQMHAQPIHMNLIKISVYALLMDWLVWLEFNSRILLKSENKDEIELRKSEALKTLKAIPIILQQLNTKPLFF